MLIEINLAPDAAGGRIGARRIPGFSLPALPAFGGDFRVLVGAGVAVLLVAFLGLSFARLGQREAAAQAQVQQEVADSTRYAATIALLTALAARQDTVTQKIEVIRGVDTRRYVWPHLLNEISLAVPPYTWLTEISSMGTGEEGSGGPVFTLQGNAGSTPALTRFMKNLEESSFIRDVTLITSEQEDVEGRTIQRFSLEARFRVPEPGAIETIPVVVID